MEDGRVSIVLIIKNPRALASSPISVDIYMNHTQRLDEIFLGFVSKYLAQRAASKKSYMMNLWKYIEDIEDIGVGLTFKPHRVISLFFHPVSFFSSSLDCWIDGCDEQYRLI